MPKHPGTIRARSVIKASFHLLDGLTAASTLTHTAVSASRQGLPIPELSASSRLPPAGRRV